MKEITNMKVFSAIIAIAITLFIVAISPAQTAWEYKGRVINSSFNTTVPSTTTTILPTFRLANSTASGGFFNSSVVTFVYTGNFACNPALTKLINTSEAANALGLTSCEVGAAGNTVGALPLWIAVPAYAGLSIFGLTQLGATSQGFPTFNNTAIYTDCGAGLTNSLCPDHPALLYSPLFSSVEKYINSSKTTWFGLPEGVLPTPAHSHIVSTINNGVAAPWYVITVLVLDPNIMPNTTTGICKQVVQTNISNPTGNCLTSLTALQAAFKTQSSDVPVANKNNPIYKTLVGTGANITAQVVVPGVTVVTQLNSTNTNVAIPFLVKRASYYVPLITTSATTTAVVTTAGATSASTTITGGTTASGGGNTTTYIIIAIVVIVIIIAAWYFMSKKKM